MIGYSSNLTIFISPSTVGKYTCHVSVRGYRDVSASSHVYARGPPVIVKSPETRVHYGALGDNVQVKFRPLITLIQSSVVTNSKIRPNTKYRIYSEIEYASNTKYRIYLVTEYKYKKLTI